MGVSITVAGATFSNTVDYLYPFAADLTGVWLFGTDEATSRVNLITGAAQGQFYNSPTFSANGFTADGPTAKYFDSELTQGGAYTIVAVSGLPTTLARVAGFYDAGSSTVGTHAINSDTTAIKHIVNNSTRGTLSRTVSANSFTGQRVVMSSFDGSTAQMAVYEGGRPLAPAAFPTVSTPPATFSFKAGGGRTDVYTGGMVINAAMFYHRALSTVEFDEVYSWLAAKMAERSVTLG